MSDATQHGITRRACPIRADTFENPIRPCPAVASGCSRTVVMLPLAVRGQSLRRMISQ